MVEIQARREPADGLTDNWKKIIALLRKILRDFAPLNRLLDGEESSDSDLALALFTTMDDINGTPPITAFVLTDILQYSQLKLLLDGAACDVVESVVLHYARNEIRFTDAGISVSVSDKASSLLRWYQLKKSEYEQKKLRFKTAVNMESIMKTSDIGVHSEYFNLLDYTTAQTK